MDRDGGKRTAASDMTRVMEFSSRSSTGLRCGGGVCQRQWPADRNPGAKGDTVCNVRGVRLHTVHIAEDGRLCLP